MRAIGLVLAGGSSSRLGTLSLKRVAAAMPVGGVYRAVDFSLSSMTNSGIRKIGVMVQHNSGSLHNHLSSSKWWDLGRKKGGLFMFSPYLTAGHGSGSYRGTANAMYQNISFLKRSKEPYVVITSGDAVYKMNFNLLIDHHVEKGHDITVAYQDMPGLDHTKFGMVEVGPNDEIISFEEKPLESDLTTASIGTYVIGRELLIQLLEETGKEGRNDFVRDIIIRYKKRYKVGAYNFTDYWRILNSIDTYFQTNMDFLNAEIRDYFTKKEPFIVTKPKDAPPAKHNSNSSTKGSLIGSGTILSGHVENSVLFNDVFVDDNTRIKNSLILSKCKIGKNCVIENAILDKQVEVSDGTHIIGEGRNLRIIEKGSII